MSPFIFRTSLFICLIICSTFGIDNEWDQNDGMVSMRLKIDRLLRNTNIANVVCTSFSDEQISALKDFFQGVEDLKRKTPV
jgi:hypothetical protein